MGWVALSPVWRQRKQFGKKMFCVHSQSSHNDLTPVPHGHKKLHSVVKAFLTNFFGATATCLNLMAFHLMMLIRATVEVSNFSAVIILNTHTCSFLQRCNRPQRQLHVESEAYNRTWYRSRCNSDVHLAIVQLGNNMRFHKSFLKYFWHNSRYFKCFYLHCSEQAFMLTVYVSQSNEFCRRH